MDIVRLRIFCSVMLLFLGISSFGNAQGVNGPSLGGIQNGSLAAGTLRAQIAPIARIDGARYKITEFSLIIQSKSGGGDVQTYGVKNPNGACFADNKLAKLAIENLKSGDMVSIENIKAVGPDKRVRPLAGIKIKCK